jgi:PAS domain S-box-containing protein
VTPMVSPSHDQLHRENDELRLRLEEAVATIEAIRGGEVDSLVIEGPRGPRVYALEGASASYRVLVETMREGAATVGRSGTVLYCNRRLAQMLGLPLEQVMGSRLRDHAEPGELDTLDALLGAAWSGQARGELSLRTAGGGPLRVQLSLGLLAEAEPALCLVVTDLTDVLRAEELRRDQEELREAARRKDEFLGMLSHELRNPLAPILNCAHVLRHAEPGSEPARHAQAVIERQAMHMSRIVDDLLDVTRIARGKMELRRAPADLREVVLRAAEDYRVPLDERGIAFRVEVVGQPCWASVDATRVTQLIGNLLHNAAKFTPDGGEVVISLAACAGAAEIRVRDSGSGVDPALLPTVFDLFVQGDGTLARSNGGLGLGLALVKGIAELHGGSVRVESAGQARGAEFTVRLPLAAVEEVAPRAPPEPPEHPRKGRRILVVDDNTDAAESLAELLKLLGHETDVAFDGQSALQKARASHPEVVLCDLGLPGMSGYDIARALRALGGPVRLYAVSGYAQPQDLQDAVEAGFDAHVAKPPDIDELERLLA